MSILYPWSSRCVLSCKLASSSAVHCHLSRVQFLPKSVLFNRQYFITSRYLSWGGFYYALASSTPVLTMQDILLDFHSFSGLPWWATISLATLGIRSLLVFPLAVHQNQVIGRLANLNDELGRMAPELSKEVNIAAKMYGWDKSSATKVYRKNMQQYYRKFILRDNCHPFKIVLLAIFQIPIWICFSMSLRNITFNPSLVNCDTQALYQQLKTEGTLWFTDLTVPDAFVIPILLALVNLVLVEIHALRRFGKVSKFQTVSVYVMRVFAVVVAGMATLNPTSVSFYWLCSSTFGLSQNIILMFPRVRHILRIPRIGNESSTPFKDIAFNFRKRFMS